MLYAAFKPHPALEPFVERYYILERDAVGDKPGDLPVLACYTAALVFSYADPVVQRSADGNSIVLPRSIVAGPSVSGSSIRLEGRTGVVGVTLKSAGFLRFVGISAGDVLDRRVDLELAIGREIREECERLQEASGPEARIASVEAYLLRRLALHRNHAPDWIDGAAEVLLTRRGRISIDELARQFNVSGRQLRRRFTERAGLGPKLFARLKRFGYVNALLSQRPDMDLQDVVFMAGFYDQAHLIKEFKAFCGFVPSAVRRGLAEESKDKAFNDRKLTVFYNPRSSALP